MATFVVVLSISLQLTAAVWAIRLIRFTGKRTAWYLISTALLLMAVRRIVALYFLFDKGGGLALEINEMIALAISLLMFAGVLFIEGYFRHSQHADRELREREHLFRLLFEKAGEGNLLLDQGIFIDCNVRALEMLGMDSKSQIVGRTPASISPEFQPDGETSMRKARMMIDRGMREGSVRFEWMHTRADGSLIPIDVMLTSIPLHGRMILHTSWRDVSARQRAEQALRESLQTSEDIIRSMPSGIFIYQYEAEGDRLILIGGNGEAELLTGRRIADWRGREFREIWPALSSRKSLFECLVEVVRTGTTCHPDDLVIGEDAKRKVFQVHAFRLPGQRLVVTFEDITEQKKGEEALRLSEEKHRFLVETMAQGVVYQASDGRILSTNPAGERILGLTFDQMAGRTSIDPRWRAVREDGTEFPGDAHPSMESLRTGKEIHNVMMGVFNPDRGAYRWIIIDAVPLFRPGEHHPYQVYATFTDITALKLAEEENRRLAAELEDRVRQRTSELEITNQELEAFTYSISHDLQAPVRAIQGFSHALAEKHTADLPPESLRYVEFLKASAHKMQELIDALLALSRMGRSRVHTSTVDAAHLVREVLDDLRSEFEHRTIDLRLDPLPPFAVDPTLMKQVYLNLLSNALKFTSRHERAEIHVGCTGTGPERVYFVRDNGVGFDPAHADRLFGVFQRLHRDEEFKGTGVGLAIAQRIIRRHNGWIWAESQPGNGATFYFHLHSHGPNAGGAS
jgi:PAS domain S-box-containing protein